MLNYELALISFSDLEALKSEMDPDIEVQFPPLVYDWHAGFDWLDLSVKYGDEDAIAYFRENLEDKIFARTYEQYKKKCRPDCALQDHERTSAAFSKYATT